MSNLKVTTINDKDGGSNAVLYGVAAPTGSMGFRNRLINSDMRIDQRNAGASVTLGASLAYTLDRWAGAEDTDGAATVIQDTVAPTGFTNSLKFTTTTADASLGATQFAYVAQAIEGLNVSDLAWGTASAQTVTLSFQVRSSLTGTFGGAITNSAFNRSYPFTYTISAANTWETKTVTIAGDTTGTWLTTNGVGMRVQFGLGVGSTYSGTAGAWAGSQFISATGATSVIGTLSATWQITGVQLEAGSVASPFERRDYGRELMMCQRYYQTGKTGALGYTSINTGSAAAYPMPVVMRATPTYTPVTFTNGTNTRQGATYSIDAASFIRYGLANATGATEWTETFTLSIEL